MLFNVHGTSKDPKEAYPSLPIAGHFASVALPDAMVLPARRVVCFLGALDVSWVLGCTGLSTTISHPSVAQTVLDTGKHRCSDLFRGGGCACFVELCLSCLVHEAVLTLP